jgi:hypothetical protein
MLEEMNAQGYDHIEATEMNVRVFNDTTAMVSNAGVRYKADGSELNRPSGTYVLHKNSKGWKIVTLLELFAEDVIQF